MRTILPLVASVLLLGACSKKEDPVQSGTVPTSAATSAATGETTETPPSPTQLPPVRPTASESPLGAVAVPSLRPCVATCVDNNKMRAEGAAKIEEDCREQCHQSCLKHCVSPSSDRPLQFADKCKKDCDGQLERLNR